MFPLAQVAPEKSPCCVYSKGYVPELEPGSLCEDPVKSVALPSLGHEPATVPSIPTSYSFAQAQAALQAVGLTATQANNSSTTVPNGDVIGTSPASGAQAPYGSAVTVNVSTGPPTTTVPDVKGDTVQEATSALQQSGLSVSGVSGDPSHGVVGTQPSVGSTVPTGSSVQLFTH